jgi:hypothetical protein
VREQTDPNAARPNHVATIRSFLGANEAKDGRLAGAVATYEPDVLAWIYLERGAAQHVLRTIGFVNV